MDLRSFQESFATMLLTGEATETLKAEFTHAGRLDPNHTSQAYVKNYIGSLSSSLASPYELIRNLLGEAAFDYLASLYAQRNPSTESNLNQYGGEFPALLQQEMGDELPFIGELGELAWHWHLLAYAPDEAAVDPREFALLEEREPATVFLRGPNTLKLVRTRYPLLDYWRLGTASDEEESTEAAEKKADEDDFEIRPDTEQMTIGLWRSGYEQNMEVFDQPTIAFCEGIGRGYSYGQLVERLPGDWVEGDLVAFLGGLVQKGLIVGAQCP